MSHLIKSIVLVAALSAGALVNASAPDSPNRKFDEFGDIKCEDEMARLDALTIQLQNEPQSRAAVIFFAGKMAGDKLPKRGEAEARVERIRSYLTKQRGIPAASIVVMNGGYDSNYRVQLWVVPMGAGLPKPDPISPVKDLDYRPGKLNPRDYRCGV